MAANSVMPKVSVIIPVYNVEKYLRQCLDSVVGQTLREIEIICVDDGSTDGSSAILAEYAAKDARVKVIVREHTNAGDSRNAGMAVARGEYLGFVDSDDWCGTSLFEKAYAKAKADDADVVSWRFTTFDTRTGQEGAARVFPQHMTPFSPLAYAPWARLVRRSFVESAGIRFQSLERSNDVYFACMVLTMAQRQAIVDEPLYCYRIGTGTNLQAGNAKSPDLIIDAWAAVAGAMAAQNWSCGRKADFVQAAVSSLFYTLNSIDKTAAFVAFYARLRASLADGGFLGGVSASDIANGRVRRSFRLFEQYERPLDFLVKQTCFFREQMAHDWWTGQSHLKRLEAVAREKEELEANMHKSYAEVAPALAVVVIGSSEPAVAAAAAMLGRQTVKLGSVCTLASPGAAELRAAIDAIAEEFVYFLDAETVLPSEYELEKRLLGRVLDDGGDRGDCRLRRAYAGEVWRKSDLPAGVEHLLAFLHCPPLPQCTAGGERPVLSPARRRLLSGAVCAMKALDCRHLSGCLFWRLHGYAGIYGDEESLKFICRCLHEADYLHCREFLYDRHWHDIRPRLDAIYNLAYEDVDFCRVEIAEAPKVPAAQAPLLTVVVPVFNAGRFLRRCLESLRRQTLTELEIVCVDDGSTDESAAILDEYAAIDGRIKVIHKANTGVSDTRNAGIDAATGKYLAFVDGDDWMEPEFAKAVSAVAEEKLLDVCYFDIAAFDQQTRKSFSLRWSFANQMRFFPRGSVFRPCDLPTLNLYSSSCCAAYRLDFLKASGCRFPPLALGEDSIFVYSLLPHMQRAYVINHAYYHYRRGNPMSALGRLAATGKASGSALAEQLKTAQHTVKAYLASESESLRCRIFADILYFAENYPSAREWLRQEGFGLMDAKHLTPRQCGSVQYHDRLMAVINSAEPAPAKAPAPFYGPVPLPVKLQFKSIERARRRNRQDLYVVTGQLNSKENEPIDSWTFFRWLQQNGIPSRYIMWKEHWMYPKLVAEGLDKDVIALDGDGFSDCEILRKCKDVLVRARAFVQENGLLNYAVRDWIRQLPGCAYVFLQHGVFFTNMSAKTAAWLRDTFNYVNVSSRRERDFIHGHLPPAEDAGREFCIYGGLPRWDQLKDQSSEIQGERVVLVMLTWRASFDQGMERLGESAYFHRLRALLAPDNIARLKAHGVRVVLAPHHHLANAVKNLDFGVDVEIASPNSVSYWIRHAKMLVTDFSSVSIDFHFQNKPVIYWVLDHDDLLLDPLVAEDGGKVLRAVENLKTLCNVETSMQGVLESIERYARADFALEPEKRAIAESLFMHKTDICRHVYTAVEEAMSAAAGGQEGL